MSKNHKRAEGAADGHSEHTPTPRAANGPQLDDVLAEKLAPLDEHRERTDSWMKEITSQVARLANDAEGGERRAGSIDKRIADLESRIQSLLTLTEVASLDKNPFADRGGGQRAPEMPTPHRSAPAEPAAARTEETAQPEPDASSDAAGPVVAAEEAPRPDSQRDDAPDEEAAHDAPAASSHPVPDASERVRNALSPMRRSAPEAPTPPKPPAPGHGQHPNDARAEALENPFLVAPPMEPEARPVAAPAPAGVHGSGGGTHRQTGATSGDETRRRLMILQWAELLSAELPRLDLGSFLGFYVETGWVDRPLAACVRNLAWQLHHAARYAPDARHEARTLPELHARSILVLSHLSETPVASADARRIVEDAREAIDGGPILAEH